MSISLDTASVQWPGESIHPGNSEALPIAAGVYVRQFASKACGARGFSTGTAAFVSVAPSEGAKMSGPEGATAPELDGGEAARRDR